jgi:WD40 repeat protein
LAQVFASCSADQTIRIWDARKKQGSALTIAAHDAHVNVINWNKAVNYLMVSGGDEGLFKVWDMRTFSRYVVAEALGGTRCKGLQTCRPSPFYDLDVGSHFSIMIGGRILARGHRRCDWCMCVRLTP